MKWVGPGQEEVSRLLQYKDFHSWATHEVRTAVITKSVREQEEPGEEAGGAHGLGGACGLGDVAAPPSHTQMPLA